MSIRRSRWSQLPGHLVATSIGGSENGESGGVDGSPPNVDHGRRRQWHAAGLSGAGALETRWVLNGNAVPQGRMLTMVRRGVRARQGSDVRRIHGTSFCFRRVFAARCVAGLRQFRLDLSSCCISALPDWRVQKWSGPTDLETSKLDGGYADHNNKIRVAECARDWACDPLRIAANRIGLDLGATASTKLGAR